MHKTLFSIITACLLLTLPSSAMEGLSRDNPGLIRGVLHAFNCCGLRTKANLELLRAGKYWNTWDLKRVQEALSKIPAGGEKACVLYLKKMAEVDVRQGGTEWGALDYAHIIGNWFLGAETFRCLGPGAYKNKDNLKSLWQYIGYQKLETRYKFLTVAEEFRGDADWDSQAYYDVMASQARVPAESYDICVRLTKQLADTYSKASGVKWTGRDILDAMTALSKVPAGQHDDCFSHTVAVAESDLRSGAERWSPENYALFMGAWFKDAPTYKFLGEESHATIKFRKKMCQMLNFVTPQHRSLFMRLAESIRGDKLWKVKDFKNVFEGLEKVAPGMHEACVLATKKMFEQEFARNQLEWAGFHYGKILEALGSAPEGVHDLCVSHGMSLVWAFPDCPHTKDNGRSITYWCSGDVYISNFMYPPYIEALAAIPSGGLEQFLAHAKKLAATNRWCIRNFYGILRALAAVPQDQHDLCVSVTTALRVGYWWKWDYESLIKTLGHLPRSKQDQYIENYPKEAEGKVVWGPSDAVNIFKSLVDKDAGNTI